jgi:protein-tyrosine phosphatase
MNLLFICSKNQWRSPTAEKIFANREGIATRSAGTAASARTKVSEKQLIWADLIFVMEKKHKTRIMENFAYILADKIIYILEIEDEYQFMDETLIDILEQSVNYYLELHR